MPGPLSEVLQIMSFTMHMVMIVETIHINKNRSNKSDSDADSGGELPFFEGRVLKCYKIIMNG